jgi:hypothetical protein
MTALYALFEQHGWWIFSASVATFVGSVAILPVLVVRIPADYFVGDGGGDSWAAHHPLVRITVLIVKNLVGWLLVTAGIVMLVTPGQGILTILIGLSLLDLPGKRALERRLVGSPAVFEAINAIRARARRPPLRLD